MFQKVLVAIDGSEHSKPVLKAAAELAAQVRSTLRVVHVLEMGFAGRAGQVELEDQSEVQQLVADAVAELESKGASVSGTVRAAQHGRVAGEIVDEADEWGADAIITGTRGLTDLEGILLGSTAHKLLHVTKVPVLVVR